MVRTLSTSALIDAEPEEVGISSARLANLSRVVQAYVDEGKISGATTMVARHNRLVHFETYGRMDDETGRPTESDTIYRIYSMTKPIASVALMTLYEEGRFQLDDPASKFIPAFKGIKVFDGGDADNYRVREPAREITIRDLLTHLAGFGSRGPGPATTTVGELYARAGVAGIPSQGTLAEQMERIATVPLQSDPGANWIYSLSTDVVARLCEVISGEPFDAFLARRIFQPLGMSDTFFFVPAAKRERLAACYRPTAAGGYELQDAPATSQFASDGTYFSGVGGLLSTAPDYLRFARMLANGGELEGARIVGPRTLRLMTMNHLPGGCDIASIVQGTVGAALHGTGFGLGFAVLLDPAKAQVLGSPGEYYWSGAASTEFFVSPQDDLVVIFMTQLMGAQGYTFRRDIRIATYQALLD